MFQASGIEDTGVGDIFAKKKLRSFEEYDPDSDKNVLWLLKGICPRF